MRDYPDSAFFLTK